MITHFAGLQLNTASVQGIKQFYQDQLGFPVVMESDNEIVFQTTEHSTLTFRETDQPLAPVHFAFQVPFSEFDYVVDYLNKSGVTLLKWPDGKIVDDFETRRNIYFRDADGNLLEIAAHSYLKEDVLASSGELKILYLREVGFPVDSVIEFREWFVDLFDFKLDQVSDLFTFAIGGTAHVVIPSKKRKWSPIAMTAIPHTMNVTFGVSSLDFIDKIQTKLAEKGIRHENREEGQLYFQLNGYNFYLKLTDFPENVPALLNLPYSN